MKLSCLPVSLFGALSAGEWTLLDWFEFARDLGLDGAGVSVAHLESRNFPALQRLRRQAGMAGVKIAMLVTDCDFTHPDPEVRIRQQDQLRVDIESASVLRAPFLRITAGPAHPDVARADGIDWAVDGLTSQLEFARRAGVTLVYENQGCGYGGWCDEFSGPADIFTDVISRTADTGLWVLFDTANAYAAGHDGMALLDAIIDRVVAVQVGDVSRARQRDPVLLGTGMVPLQAILQRLRAHGFDGWMSVKEASQSGRAGFRQAIPHCRRVWAASS